MANTEEPGATSYRPQESSGTNDNASVNDDAAATSRTGAREESSSSAIAPTGCTVATDAMPVPPGEAVEASDPKLVVSRNGRVEEEKQILAPPAEDPPESSTSGQKRKADATGPGDENDESNGKDQNLAETTTTAIAVPATPTAVPTGRRRRRTQPQGTSPSRGRGNDGSRAGDPHGRARKAPIRSVPDEYESKICVVAGCGRLRSRGERCHRHHEDPADPARNQSDRPADRKKTRGTEKRDRPNELAPVPAIPASSFDADGRWNELFPRLQKFYRKNGHSRVPTSEKTDLTRFVVHIRCAYQTEKQKMLTAAAAQAATRSSVTPRDAPEIADRCTKVEPPTTPVHPGLAKSKLLTPKRIKALEKVKFEFQLRTAEPSQWEQRFQELLAYRRKNGNFNVTNKQNTALSSWCKRQRQRYKNTMAIYQGLYGVELTCPQKKTKELYEKAKGKAKDVKTTLAATGDGMEQALIQTPRLSDIGEAKNRISPDHICKLNAVGFKWELQKDTFVESWENRYNELLKFKVINGHCRVPISSVENPQLGQWVKQMRKYHGWKEDGKPYPATFTEERIARLNELGFEWRLMVWL